MRGHTLVELLFVLLIMGVTAGSVAPAARRQRDRARVVAARETVVGLLAEARAAAMASGAASVRLSAAAAVAEVLEDGAIVRVAALGRDLGVAITLGGADTEVELVYDALGLGRMASQTIAFRRGRESTELVVSAYGRVRRR